MPVRLGTTGSINLKNQASELVLGSWLQDTPINSMQQPGCRILHSMQSPDHISLKKVSDPNTIIERKPNQNRAGKTNVPCWSLEDDKQRCYVWWGHLNADVWGRKGCVVVVCWKLNPQLTDFRWWEKVKKRQYVNVKTGPIQKEWQEKVGMTVNHQWAESAAMWGGSRPQWVYMLTCVRELAAHLLLPRDVRCLVMVVSIWLM